MGGQAARIAAIALLTCAAGAAACDGNRRAGAADGGAVAGDAAAAGPAANGAAFVADPCQQREQAVGITVSCGFVRVPERQDDPAGGTILLRVAWIRASGVTPTDEPIVYLDGGPGGSSIANAIYYGAWTPNSGLQTLLGHRDLIAIDLRGTGGSTPALVCDGIGVTPLGTGEPAAAEFSVAAISDCRRTLTTAGATVSAYGTAAAVHDVQRVIAALGLARFDLVGAGYGARVALELMRAPPAQLRAVILDSVTPPDADVLPAEGAALARAYELSLAACDADAACRAEAPDARTALPEIVARLDQSPAEVSTHGGTVTLDGRAFVASIRGALLDGDRTGYLPRQLQAAKGGDYGFFAAVLGVPRGQGSIGVNLSVVCAEQLPSTSSAAIEGAAAGVTPPLALGLTARFYARACPAWMVPAAPDGLRAPVASALPTLLLAGQMDPVVPPDWSRQVARTLTAAQVVELPGAGNAVLHGPCSGATAAAFLADPTAPPVVRCPGNNPD